MKRRMKDIWLGGLAVVGVMLGMSRADAASSERYALLIGANHGYADEPTLRYAYRDASRMAETLISLGGFRPDNVIVLQDPDASTVRRTIFRLNARIRSDNAEDSVLFTFFSGHADALALHLSGTDLLWEELRNLTVGSSAGFRLLVVDSCRSGQATLPKGVALAEAFEVPELQAAPEGFVVLSSASAGEDAQESAALEASFFTHHFIAALRGAGDVNGDGQVHLREAYQYTQDRTVASTAKTLAGVQHPTYRYNIRGRSDFVLTFLDQDTRFGAVQLLEPGQYFFREEGPEGSLALEVSLSKPRAVWLAPGDYYVEHRTKVRYYVGEVSVERSTTHPLGDMIPVEYDRLVRKGGRAAAYAVTLWGQGQSALLAEFGPTWGGAAQVSVDLPSLTLDVRAAFGQSENDAELVPGTLRTVHATAGARVVFDVGPFALSGGLRAGLLWLHQSYGPTVRIAPSRTRWAPQVAVLARADVLLGAGFIAGVEAAVFGTYLEEQVDFQTVETTTPVRPSFSIGLGRYF